VGSLDEIRIDTRSTYLLTKNVYYSGLIKRLEKDGHQVLALPYDFRYIHHPEYFYDLYKHFTTFFEQQYAIQQEPMVVVCHSLGGLVFHHYLTSHAADAWTRKHIEKVYFVNVPMGGTPFSFYSIIDNILHSREEMVMLSSAPSAQILPFFSKRVKDLPLFGGFYMSFPIGKDPFFRKNGISYDRSNVHHIFRRHDDVLEQLDLFQTYHEPYRVADISIPHNIVYSTGYNTTTFIDADTKKLIKGDGDGLIPVSSLLWPEKQWPSSERNKRHVIHIPNMDHSRINNHDPFLRMISRKKDELVL
jgi:pimeloyl-ACP methyl ester carboxylesterase